MVKMHVLLLVATLAAMSAIVTCQGAYSCRNSYRPANYIRRLRVPPNCTLQTITPPCPRSWKSGVPQGQSASLPLIDMHFVQCHEGFTCCGYVPISNTTGQVLGQSGVTVGSGVDLGSRTSASLRAIGVSQHITDQLEPYFGLKTDRAACAAIELPLRLSCSDAQALTQLVKDEVVSEVQQRYEQDRDRQSDADAFTSLPRGIRTAIVDVWFQFGSLPQAAPTFWSHVITNDWDNAVSELRDFYGPTANPPRGDLIRRNDEADIMEAALAKCIRSIDAVFLIDESGSIGSSAFRSSLNFIRSLIDAFPDENLRGEDGTRFGLSLFESTYRNLFHLSSYSSKSQYFSALSSVRQITGGTYLGSALDQILSSQFRESRGLRPENYGIPRILIVLTDGQSGDSVALPAARVRAQNIVIYAIGIGSFDTDQLNEVASSPAHVHFLSSFSNLGDFAATLTASTCYEPQPISLETPIFGRVEKEAFQYYVFNVPEDVNLMVEVNDIMGSTLVYASRDNPHPYEYDNDFGFSAASQTNKTIIISPIAHRNKKRQVSVNATNTQSIYFSVTGVRSNTSYTLEGSTCNPIVCAEGTNEISGTNEKSGAEILQTSTFVVLLGTTVANIISMF